jgi:ferredoxin
MVDKRPPRPLRAGCHLVKSRSVQACRPAATLRILREMRVTVDLEKCTGHARCAYYGPHVYSLDEMGFCATVEAEVPVEMEAEATQGAAGCPERAITVET